MLESSSSFLPRLVPFNVCRAMQSTKERYWCTHIHGTEEEKTCSVLFRFFSISRKLVATAYGVVGIGIASSMHGEGKNRFRSVL